MKVFTSILLLTPLLCNAQVFQDKMKAFKTGQEGIALMDKGAYEEAILKLQEGASYDTANYFYPYHIAYVYVKKNDPERAIATVKQVIDTYEDAPEQCYQMLGNLYDEQHNSQEALDVYDAGLKKYPGSGRLYMEKGIVLAYRENETEAAVACWEKGVEKEPDFPSNYYWLAKHYCNSKDKLWGILYGEIFLHMEHDTERAFEISNFIYDAYEEAIQLESKTVTVELAAENSKGEFSSTCEKLLTDIGQAALKKKKLVDLEAICKMRVLFTSSWTDKGYHQRFPNIIFDYNKRVADAGHLEAYIHWLLKEGNKESFFEWKQENEQKYKDFLSWMDSNRLTVNRKNRFYRGQFN